MIQIFPKLGKMWINFSSWNFKMKMDVCATAKDIVSAPTHLDWKRHSNLVFQRLHRFERPTREHNRGDSSFCGQLSQSHARVEAPKVELHGWGCARGYASGKQAVVLGESFPCAWTEEERDQLHEGGQALAELFSHTSYCARVGNSSNCQDASY